MPRGRQLDLSTYDHLYDIYVRLNTRFYALQEPGSNGCINYTGPKHRQGYGFVGARDSQTLKRLMVTAHRVAMRIKLSRAIADTEFIIHTCSNPACVNPDHLILGDSKLRSQVMKHNGRAPVQPRGPGSKSQHQQMGRRYKYSIDDMLWMRDTATLTEITQRFGVSRSRASALRSAFKTKYRWLQNL